MSSRLNQILSLPSDPVVVAVARSMADDAERIAGYMLKLLEYVERVGDGVSVSTDREWLERHLGCPGLVSAVISHGAAKYDGSNLVLLRWVPKSAGKPPKHMPSVPLQLNTPAFLSAWDDWLKHRKQMNKPVTAVGAEGQLKKCLSWGEQIAIRNIRMAIDRGWQGLFEPLRADMEKKAASDERAARIMKLVKGGGK